MRKIIILENIRSAYNVGNIIRTADALGWEVWMTGYTPAPEDSNRVGKSALGSQDYVPLQSFVTTEQAIVAARDIGCHVIAAEVTAAAKNLRDYKSPPAPSRHVGTPSQSLSQGGSNVGIAVVFGNEVVGVDPTTLDRVDDVVCIPMQGHKESLNVGQTAAIFMWELG